MKHLIYILTCMIGMTLPLCSCAQEKVTVDSVAFPKSFAATKKNELQGAEHLGIFFHKLESGEGQARVLHIGDSHVRGHYFPGYVRKALEVSFDSKAMGDDKMGYSESAIATETGLPGLVYSAIGINGAQVQSFLKPEMIQKIAEQKPMLVIMSFGTNEAYGDKYSAERHARYMDKLVAAIREACSDSVEFLLTTPPGCMKKGKYNAKYPNPNNGAVAKAIVAYAQSHGMAVWDMFSIFGGELTACRNWQREKLLNPDGVHFNNSGYALQGRMLGKAIAEAFNKR